MSRDNVSITNVDWAVAYETEKCYVVKVIERPFDSSYDKSLFVPKKVVHLTTDKAIGVDQFGHTIYEKHIRQVESWWYNKNI